MLPLDRNFFRAASGLTRSLARLDENWEALLGLRASGRMTLRAREAAALTVTSRWAYRSALARVESRGMQRRLDALDTDPSFLCAIEAAGLDRITVARRAVGPGAPPA
jgi:succinate dehydrogenase/fumarate reductase flavoprotein subunit